MINSNQLVIFDRYIYSAIAYRCAEGLDKDWIIEVNKYAPQADLKIYIDISAEESLRRQTEEKENIDYTVDYLCKVREVYLHLVNSGELVLLDGMDCKDVVAKKIISLIELAS